MNAGVLPRRRRAEVRQRRRRSRPGAQLDEYVDWPLLIARSEPIADASLPDMRARSRPGTAIAAMMPMMATTISSSMSVKPLALRIFMSLSCPLRKRLFPAMNCFVSNDRVCILLSNGGAIRAVLAKWLY